MSRFLQTTSSHHLQVHVAAELDRLDIVSMVQAVHQSSAVLGLGLIGMAEDLGSAMAHRALEHLLQYGDSAVRSVHHASIFTTTASVQSQLPVLITLPMSAAVVVSLALSLSWVHPGNRA